jgi:hypothetical protein
MIRPHQPMRVLLVNSVDPPHASFPGQFYYAASTFLREYPRLRVLNLEVASEDFLKDALNLNAITRFYSGQDHAKGRLHLRNSIIERRAGLNVGLWMIVATVISIRRASTGLLLDFGNIASTISRFASRNANLYHEDSVFHLNDWFSGMGLSVHVPVVKCVRQSYHVPSDRGCSAILTRKRNRAENS